MLNADVHLLLLRPTRVPVAGEAVSEGFQGQVELDGWTWSFHNEDEKKKADAAAETYSKKKGLADTRASQGMRLDRAQDEYQKALDKLDEEFEADKAKLEAKGTWDAKKGQRRAERKKELDALNKTLTDKQDDIFGREKTKTADEAESEDYNRRIAELDRNTNFEFTFSKRVDISTTQLLNSMKAGDVFPSGVLTIHQRSTNAGLSLVINVQRVRLLDYSLKCDTSETMTTMKEEWTCEFGSLGYVYKSKDMVYLSSSASQNVPRAMTQGQVRAFAMKNIGSPI